MTRRLPWVAAIALAVPASVFTADDDVRASCLASLSWNGSAYRGVGSPYRAPLRLGARVGRGLVPPCNDTDVPGVPAEPEKASLVRLRRIRGVSPVLAVYNTSDRAVYTADGFFPELPSHPLHRLFYGSRRGEPSELRFPGTRCSSLSSTRGRVIDAAYGGVTLRRRARRGTQRVEIDALTGIAGFRRAGQPYLRRHDLIWVRGWRCRNGDFSPGRFLVARQIRPAPERPAVWRWFHLRARRSAVMPYPGSQGDRGRSLTPSSP